MSQPKLKGRCCRFPLTRGQQAATPKITKPPLHGSTLENASSAGTWNLGSQLSIRGGRALVPGVAKSPPLPAMER
jgi:hypothetical protein